MAMAYVGKVLINFSSNDSWLVLHSLGKEIASIEDRIGILASFDLQEEENIQVIDQLRESVSQLEAVVERVKAARLQTFAI
jgi:hypothetical protein